MPDINENLQRLQTAKTNISTAITNKGGTVSPGDGYEEFANDILSIPVSPPAFAFLYVNAPEGTQVTVLESHYALLYVTAPSGATITVTNGDITLDSQTSTGEELTFEIPLSGTWTVSGINGQDTDTKTITIDTLDNNYYCMLFVHVYGASWDKSSSTVLTRTDGAENFSDPNPYYSGMTTTPSSPFDDIMPWSGMEIVTRDDGNVLVKIPKFWYKITNTSNELKFQIANKETDGFLLAPAFRDIGNGEYDYAYVGRYHCSGDSNSAWKSVAGVTPKGGTSPETARINIPNLGTGYNQFDFAMYWTICMLYIVEFANWNSQTCIGYGCGNDSSIESTGYTDSMLYHTGTTKSGRTTYGLGTQYRYIEGLWDNVMDFVDGILYKSKDNSIYCSLNPSDYSDLSTNGTNIGTRSQASTYKYIVGFLQPSNNDFDWALTPRVVEYNGSTTTYICDTLQYYQNFYCLSVGGSYYQLSDYGLFQWSVHSPTGSGLYGCRLLWRPY